jgi:hypothetical protein
MTGCGLIATNIRRKAMKPDLDLSSHPGRPAAYQMHGPIQGETLSEKMETLEREMRFARKEMLHLREQMKMTRRFLWRARALVLLGRFLKLAGRE